jgi:hypothetical protein
VLSFLLSVVLKIIDFKQHMGFKGSFNRNYLRMKKRQFSGYAGRLRKYGFQIAPGIVVIGKK